MFVSRILYLHCIVIGCSHVKLRVTSTCMMNFFVVAAQQEKEREFERVGMSLLHLGGVKQAR